MKKLLTLGFAAVALGALTLGACGGDDDASKTTRKDEPAQAATPNPGDNKTSSGTTVAATAEPAKKDLVEVSDAEREWLVVKVCPLALAVDKALGALPGARQAPGLSVEERRRRVEVLWPLQAEIHERFVGDMDRIKPPERGQKIHGAIRDLSERQAADLRRALNEINDIFVSASTIQANNDRFRQTIVSATRRINNELDSEPALLRLLDSRPECPGDAGPPQAGGRAPGG